MKHRRNTDGLIRRAGPIAITASGVNGAETVPELCAVQRCLSLHVRGLGFLLLAVLLRLFILLVILLTVVPLTHGFFLFAEFLEPR
jgi:hypothetical protein